ncbi:DISARM system helicase DrmA [Actinomadura sp. BRA 177]|uniref:DISARM system helicase DrmA n=1 Tax=Actinomadura sp. BRA 177 TaxID=2745202 RepID=UPI0015955C4C|nr:DISARM system helicase DrmA [Actinomadura sp. BRA 177]NVI90700.1 helicase [Actinomadura sp. BRA 177]
MSEEDGGLFPQPGDVQLSLVKGEDAVAKAPLDVPQTFAEAGSFEVRDELEELVRRDLLGPWDGPSEEFKPKAMGPRERYLVGMLGPRHSPASTLENADQVPDTETGVDGDAAEGGLPEVVSPQTLGKIWASSMGLSFCVGADVDAVVVKATWGHYDQHEQEGEDGKKVRVWARKPVTREEEVRLDAEESYKLPLTGEHEDAPGVLLSVNVRPRDGRRVVEVALVNQQTEPTSNKDTAWLFQPELTVTALDGAKAIFLPVDDPADDLQAVGDDAEELHLRLLYRNERRYAAGRNVAVHPDVAEGSRTAHRLTTTWLPVHNVPATIAPTGPGTPLEHVTLSMDVLAKAAPAQLKQGLQPLVDGYNTWLDAREAEIPGLPDGLKDAARRAGHDARRAANRIEAGVRLLSDETSPGHREALAAFHFANEAMALQRRHTALVPRREEGLGYDEALRQIDAQGEKAASWRPFQLAFVLLNLPSLTDPGHPERAADDTALVDLLFFPTGGGKTEAYLGLTAYTFAIRRLQRTLGTAEDARDGMAGVAVLMRYTLRLLTAQQFQRAAALVCAAEVIRRNAPATWGDERFRIGLWVGAGVSPNWFDDAKDQVIEARDQGSGHRANVLQTLACPWCGEGLRAERDLHIDDDRRRILLYCPRGEGDACPFSRKVATGEGLPILTVDEEIYRYAPSLVIATVDKLAQLPWKGYAGILFGRTRSHCDRHGFRHDDLDDKTGCASKHNKKGALPAVSARPVVRLRPPDLIIQDELHLISGALGTTVGLFEAAVAELSSWLHRGSRTGPKIVASTATTKRAREQVRGVFGRELAVFPPQVTDVADTFFSRQEPITKKAPGRRYLGICAHGVRIKSAEIRLAEILLLAGQTLFDKYGAPADPYMTMVGYFNATRELAGMRRYLDDDVTTRVRRHGKAKGLSDRIVQRGGMLAIQELTSRISSGDISDVLKLLEHDFDPDLDTSRRRAETVADMRRHLQERKDSKAKVVPAHPLAQRFYDRGRAGLQPVDVVLATSMLQVGVDVSRFGLMVMVGQPKNTAEYIQASSRVGRDAERPGLVVTLYNWSRPRDLAHYEDFEHYHSTFYRQVEALSVTPYTRRSLDRGTAGTLVAAIRHAAEDFSRNPDAFDVDRSDPRVQDIVDRMLARAEAVAGTRGRDYLNERAQVVLDAWEDRKTGGSARLGYQDGTWNKQTIKGLLRPAGSGRWETMTTGMSMRETENEINLLFPSGEAIYHPLYNEPDWSFGPPADPDEDEPEGDELGQSTLDAANGRETR